MVFSFGAILNWYKNPWVLWFLGSLLFFSEYFVRTSSSVMVGDLMQDFMVDAVGIGTLSAFFYYPYTFMQLPVGVLFDRFPTGKLLTLMSALFALGCFLFARSKSLLTAELARSIMGFSAAFAFVGTLKLVTEKFDSKMLGILAGTTQALGMLGAATGEGPVAEIIESIGWRSAMSIMACFIAMISLVLLLLAWKSDNRTQQEQFSLLKDLKQAIIKNKQTLINALFAGLIYAPTLAFGEVWGVEYLESVYKMPHESAAAALSWIFIGWGIGGPFQGLVSDRIGKRKPLLYFSAGSSLILLSIILFANVSFNKLILLMFLYGFANSGLVVSYAISGEINPAQQTGTTIALTNMSSVLLGACCQPIISALLVYYWDHSYNNVGVPLYNALAYKNSMIFLPFLLILALIVSKFIKETNCSKVQK